jgi:putative ABC transport system permease protein
MHAIWRQAKADLLSRRTQSVLILFIVAAAATLLTVGVTATSSVRAPFERAFAASNGAHVWIHLQGDEATQARAAQQLAALPGVQATTGLRHVLYGNLFFSDQHEYVILIGLSPEPPAIARPIVVAGRYFAPGDGDVILLDHNLARNKHLHAGDTVDFLTPSGRRTLTIVGLTLNVENAPYPNWQPAINYVPEAGLPALAGDSKQWGKVGLQLRDPQATGATWTAARAELGETAIGSTDWLFVRESVDTVHRITSMFLVTFGVFALLSAGSVIVATIGGAVLAQYRAIGLLKAVGFTAPQVVGLFVFENVLLAVIGAACGLAAGLLLAPLALRPVTETLNAPPVPVVSVELVTLLLAGVPALAALFSLWPAWQASQVNTVQAIRVGSEMPRAGVSRLARAAARVGLPPVVALGLKDVFARPLRAALLAGSVGVGVLGVTLGLGLNATMDEFIANPELRGVVYQAYFEPQHLTEAEARQVLAARPEITAYYGERWAQLDLVDPSGARGASFYARFVDAGFSAFPFEITSGRAFSAPPAGTWTPGEVVVGEGLLRLTGKSVGDDLSVQVAGRPLTLHITGTYPEMNNGGRMALGALETLRQVMPDAAVQGYYVRVRQGTDVQTLVAVVESASGSQLLGEAVDLSPPDDILRLRVVVGTLSAVLTLIALMSVFNATLMAFRERRRDFAIFKAIGLTPGQVAGTVLVGTGSLVVAATVVGLPLGVWASYTAISSLASGFGFTRDIPLAINWLGLAAVPVGALLIAAAGSALPARWAARLKVAEVLRYE